MYTQLPRKIDFRHFEVITRSKRRKQSIQDVEDNRQRGQRCTVKNLGEIFKDMAPGGAARGRETRVFLNYRIRQGSRSLLLLAQPGIPDRKSNQLPGRLVKIYTLITRSSRVPAANENKWTQQRARFQLLSLLRIRTPGIPCTKELLPSFFRQPPPTPSPFCILSTCGGISARNAESRDYLARQPDRRSVKRACIALISE